MRCISILLLLFLTVSTFASDSSKMIVIKMTQDYQEMFHTWLISGDQLKKYPCWELETQAPPVSVKQAVSLARAWLKENNPSMQSGDVKTIELTRVGAPKESHWFYAIQLYPAQGTNPGPKDDFKYAVTVVVSMQGKVIPAINTKEFPKEVSTR
jgi:hypothetical protein